MTDESLDELKRRKMQEIMKHSALDEQLRILGDHIKETNKFREFWAIQSRIEGNPGVWGLIKSFEVQKRKLAAPRVHPTDVQRLQALAHQIARNMDAIAYYQALKDLGKLLRSIHLRISEKIGFRFAMQPR
ncbi:MAG: YlbF family regulator [Candidatus Heimdallarchaeota archaeon]